MAKKLLESIQTPNAIVTGLRQLAQISFFRKNANFILLSIESEANLRFARAQSRNKLGEATNLEDFVRNEELENSGHHVQRLFECMKLADYIIKNDGTHEDFIKSLDEFMKSLKIFAQ